MIRLNKKHLIAAILLISVFCFLPKPASASVPILETNTTIITGALKDVITALSTAANLSQTYLEWAFKLAAEQLKRQLLNMIVDQIVNWIQGGGEPKFITDWPGFFRDAVDQAGGRFIQELGLGRLCSAFGFKLSAAFIPIPKFSDRSSCTLSQVGANLDAFLKDFKSGGWAAWDEMVLKPQNNIYGAYLMAWDEKNKRESAAEKAAAAEAQAGQGFLSVRRCAQTATTCATEGGCQSVCVKEEVVTPGKVVGELAGKAVGSDIDYIVNADDFAAYVSAITNAILNRVFAEGVGLLRAAVTSSGGGEGGGGATQTAAQIQCQPLVGSPAYGDCVIAVQSGTDIREFQKNHLIAFIEEDIPAQNQLLGAKQATLTVLNQSIGVLNEWGACLGSTPSQLNSVTSEINRIEQEIAAIQSDIIALQQKQQEIKAITDLMQIAAIYAQITAVVNPSKTQTLFLAAQDETNQKYRDDAFYHQQLSICLQRQQQQQQQTGGQ